ncbi:MAG: COX15/CtaA family protein [Dehalococcoidia bacterium]|nr:heme A synthase [Dehalococcoidia bacterium]
MKTAQRVALVTTLATLLLVAVGVLVRATGSGLGCPDWPTCHGGVVPPGDLGHQPIIEFSHRFVAASVGLLVIATAAYAWRYYRGVPAVLWTAILVVPMVMAQGLLGAITVWRELPPEIVATHLLTAMVILSMEAFVVVGMYRADPERGAAFAGTRWPRGGRVALLSLATFAVLLWIGGYMSESGASTACSGWPLCNGSVVPAADEHEVVHMLHRYIAAAFALPLGWLLLLLWQSRSDRAWATASAILIGGLYLVQVAVGALNVWYDFPDPLTISHTTIAATIWLTLSFSLALSLFYPAVHAQAPSASAVTA